MRIKVFIKAQSDYLVSFDRKHLLNPAAVAERSGLSIPTPDVVVRLVQERGTP